MNKDLPKIFRNNSKNLKDTNSSYYYLKRENLDDKLYTSGKYSDIKKVIKKLYKDSRYIFNIDVIISTKERSYNTKIAGIINNNIITVDDKVIPIDDVVELKIKDRY